MRYMVQHQTHFGKKFYKDLKTGYWISTCSPRIRAHRHVWISIHGKIPNGYHIHHRDENKSNNSIKNLELIERSRHLSHHYTDDMREKARKRMGEIRHLTKEWHASEEGIKWHKAHGSVTWKNRKPKKYKCEVCKSRFESKKVGSVKFCSNNCKSKYRRYSGIDNIVYKCKKCEKEFVKNKYSKQLYCSRECLKLRRL